jgi:hypothetical protein
MFQPKQETTSGRQKSIGLLLTRRGAFCKQKNINAIIRQRQLSEVDINRPLPSHAKCTLMSKKVDPSRHTPEPAEIGWFRDHISEVLIMLRHRWKRYRI